MAAPTFVAAIRPTTTWGQGGSATRTTSSFSVTSGDVLVVLFRLRAQVDAVGVGAEVCEREHGAAGGVVDQCEDGPVARIDVVACWNIFRWMPFAPELLKFVFAKFVEQDRKTMEDQSQGLKHNPHLM